jgi:hypothetical protein
VAESAGPNPNVLIGQRSSLLFLACSSKLQLQTLRRLLTNAHVSLKSWRNLIIHRSRDDIAGYTYLVNLPNNVFLDPQHVIPGHMAGHIAFNGSLSF